MQTKAARAERLKEIDSMAEVVPDAYVEYIDPCPKCGAVEGQQCMVYNSVNGEAIEFAHLVHKERIEK